MTLGQIFFSEFLGTMILIILGVGVVANNVLPKNNGFGAGFLMVNFGWGIGVLAGVYAAYKSGGHINPAVTLGIAASGVDEFVPGIAVDLSSILVYLSAQFSGAFVGAVLAWAAYKRQFDEHGDAPTMVFATGPQVPNPAWNVITEVVATFVLVFGALTFGAWQGKGTILEAVPVALLVVGIGASLGGPTGYAINPARDLSPRIAHALLPIPKRSDNNWAYSWIPVVGPIIGGVIGGIVFHWYAG